MKGLIIFSAAVLLMMEASAQTLRVMTYNIRYDNPADGPNAWTNRKEFLAEQVIRTNPDILGIQESLHSQVEWLSGTLKGYGHAGIGRDENGSGESVTVFFRMERFELRESNTFWLSETPTKLSKGWDAALPRICTYVRLRDRKTGQNFLVLNTHFDHVGNDARKESAKLLVKKMTELSQPYAPVILLGDFNSTPDSFPVILLTGTLKDARLLAANVTRPQIGSYNGFDTSKPAENLIDHIFVSGDLSVEKYEMLVELRDNRYPSDHFPVVADLLLRK